ncbi:hypothetical protein B0H14DRAFT_2894376 [Mycena olivaceomarginata]|nr:hypothetical protein B0H14DRAFT_2894376 [Mycena olivaceomarginata]
MAAHFGLISRHLNKERPSIGASWLLLAMPVTVLLFWLRIWSDWLRIGIIWRNRFKNILYAFTTLGGALVVLLQLYISRRRSMSITWIAACVYFAWSPDLTRTGLLVVCGVFGWITIFTRAPYHRTSPVSVQPSKA